MSNTSLINKTRVKRFVLSVANDAHKGGAIGDTYIGGDGKKWNWAGANKAREGRKYTQVSQELIDELDHAVRKMIDKRIRSTQQTGKTVK